MTRDPTIDVATDDRDLASIRPLMQEHIAYELSDAVIPDDWEQVAAHQVLAGNVVIFAARIDGLTVGYASMTSDVATWTGERFGHLDCLYVDEARRGAGFGRLLLHAVVSDARARGYRELQWQTPEWNSVAIRFYERSGAARRPKERFTLIL